MQGYAGVCSMRAPPENRVIGGAVRTDHIAKLSIHDHFFLYLRPNALG